MKSCVYCVLLWHIILLVQLSAEEMLLPLACAWTSTTQTDERNTHATDFDLIVGQFAHHSDYYYQDVIKKLSP